LPKKKKEEEERGEGRRRRGEDGRGRDRNISFQGRTVFLSLGKDCSVKGNSESNRKQIKMNNKALLWLFCDLLSQTVLLHSSSSILSLTLLGSRGIFQRSLCIRMVPFPLKLLW
jgi:hypothetical protein